MKRSPRGSAGALAFTLAVFAVSLAAQAPAPSKGVTFPRISEPEVREWLTTLSSDAMQGRKAFTEGYGLAASYVAEQLKRFGVRPLGDTGTYFQTVRRQGYRATRNSIITVRANGQDRVFKHGDHVTFAANGGGRQSLRFDRVDVVGYGLVAERAGERYSDFTGRDVNGRLVMWLPGTPASIGPAGGTGRGALITAGNRSSFVINNLHAAAVLAFQAAAAPSPAEAALGRAQAAVEEATAAVREQAGARSGRGGRGGGRGAAAGAALPASDFATTERVDRIAAPVITGDEEFYRALFAGAATSFDDLCAKAEKGEPLEPFTLAGVEVTIQIDNQYELVSTELSRNVVGIVEGADARLKDTYVFYGAHLDHVGYRFAPTGRGAQSGSNPDLIYNGADDDASGSSALIALAKAFASGPKPRRSAVFVWHTGEEDGLTGSRYMADHPVVPVEKIRAQINIDMVGRNRHDDAAQNDNVFVVGADRISTDLHNLLVATNHSLRQPLHLDFEYNDPTDPNTFYTRSDHFSYALKGIPVAFFFTGVHPDYHQVTDHVDKILFPKLVRITQLAYQLGFNVANSDRELTRDNRGPRSGRGFQGAIE
jgi:hypothetical protein